MPAGPQVRGMGHTPAWPRARKPPGLVSRSFGPFLLIREGSGPQRGGPFPRADTLGL